MELQSSVVLLLRKSTVAIAYLMAKKGLSLTQQKSQAPYGHVLGKKLLIVSQKGSVIKEPSKHAASPDIP